MLRLLIPVFIVLTPLFGQEITCTICDGSGSAPCVQRGCTEGRVICSEPCLKPSEGKWVKLKGQDPKKVWRQFREKGGSQAWSNHHYGEVIKKGKDGRWYNAGKCKVCGGKTTVACASCEGKGRVSCEVCAGTGKTTEEAIAAYLAKLEAAKYPHHIHLTSGEVIDCKIIATMNGTITYKIDKTMATV